MSGLFKVAMVMVVAAFSVAGTSATATNTEAASTPGTRVARGFVRTMLSMRFILVRLLFRWQGAAPGAGLPLDCFRDAMELT